MTGINIFNLELAAKRLELLRQLVPKAVRIAVLTNPADAAATHTQFREVEAAARSMGLQVNFTMPIAARRSMLPSKRSAARSPMPFSS